MNKFELMYDHFRFMYTSDPGDKPSYRQRDITKITVAFRYFAIMPIMVPERYYITSTFVNLF